MKNLNLQEMRGRLDVIDSRLVQLLEERMDICAQVAEFKMETGKAVYDPEREAQKLETLGSQAQEGFYRQAVQELFSQIMTISRRQQYQLMAQNGFVLDTGFTMVDSLNMDHIRVVYQGVEGAYTHGAAMKFFGDKTELYHVAQWEDAMKEVEEGRADYAVLPIENSSAGAVSQIYDLLVKHNNYIVGETQLKVEHALLGLADATIEDIKSVYSHPQALMQCSEYLNSNRQWRQISVANTAIAARKVIDDGDRSQAAVASLTAAKLYGLKVLAESINYNKHNTTRFIVLSSKAQYCRDARKVSLCFEVPHRSGSLYNILGNFIYNHINMLMIESRPIEGRSWEYRFFVDIEGNLSEPAVQNALKGISQEATAFRILGNY